MYHVIVKVGEQWEWVQKMDMSRNITTVYEFQSIAECHEKCDNWHPEWVIVKVVEKITQEQNKKWWHFWEWFRPEDNEQAR